jgi:hypothetical protein
MASPDLPPPPPGSDAPAADIVHEKPEILVGGAFVGAFLFARILKRITS